MPTTFEHPDNAYRLTLPDGWGGAVDKDNGSYGFCHAEHTNVVLWLGIMPMRFNYTAHEDKLRDVFRAQLKGLDCVNVRREPQVRHLMFVADRTEPEQDGTILLVAVADLLLLGSTLIPKGQRHMWMPTLHEILNSIDVDRRDDMERMRLAEELAARLNRKWPSEGFLAMNGVVRSQSLEIGVDNLRRAIRENPDQRESIIGQFVGRIVPVEKLKTGNEAWDDVSRLVFPALKPKHFADPGQGTDEVIRQDWIGDSILVYAIQLDRAVRFVNTWDMERWKLDVDSLHAQAIRNVQLLPWPDKLQGLHQPGGGKMLLISTGDMFNASRILHPGLHDLLAKFFGSPFYAAVPDRDTLIVFSATPALRRKFARQVRKDYQKSAYQISPQVFLVTPDGIAVAPDSAL